MGCGTLRHNVRSIAREASAAPAAKFKSRYRVRREKAVVHSGSNPPGNWFAPPGSNQSSDGGNEIAEASGAESR